MTSSKKQVWVIVNPISGVKAKKEAIVFLQSELSSLFSITIKETQFAGHAKELAKNAVENNVDAVIAVGGDGTVNEIASQLIHTDVALGIVPFGSGNGFARHLEIPLQAKAAIEVIKKFNTQKVDSATINGTPFFATAGFGFDALVAKKFDLFGKRGFIAYSQVALNEFITYIPKKYKLIIDGVKVKRRAFIVCFANAGQYGNNAWIAPNASLKDGKLKVVILKPFASHLTPDILLKVFNKNLAKSTHYEEFEAKKIVIKKPRRFHIDGEPKKKLKKSITIEVVPSSLRVIC